MTVVRLVGELGFFPARRSSLKLHFSQGKRARELCFPLCERGRTSGTKSTGWVVKCQILDLVFEIYLE